MPDAPSDAPENANLPHQPEPQPEQNAEAWLDQMAVMQEPPFDPEDTPPSGILRRNELEHKTNPRITDKVKIVRPAPNYLNWILTGAALFITFAAAGLYLWQTSRPAPQPTAQIAVQPTSQPTIKPTDKPTQVPTLAPTVTISSATPNEAAAVPVDVIAELLAQPGITVPPADRIFRQQVAYTIAPARTRSTVTEYEIQPGDILDKIAARFGLATDTLVWANDDIYVNSLRPGDKLTILPENGVLHVTKGEETIQSIADKYKVSPFVIIDSEYNRLQNARPDTLLPTNYSVVIPGGTGTAKPRYWNPGVAFRRTDANSVPSAGASNNAQGEISFGGGPGSCGYQPNSGGGGLRVPLGSSYTVIRGFYPGHTGIDLAAPPGTPVYAAATGTVIFAGWSNWGYGNSIVLAHGDKLTLYGHLSRINVSCGQKVGGGDPIGAVGSTGNSSGPHLHFEIRPGGGEPVNPVGYLAF